MRFVPDPYVFVLFEQSDDNVRLTQRWRATFANRNIYLQVEQFQEDFNLFGTFLLKIDPKLST